MLQSTMLYLFTGLFDPPVYLLKLQIVHFLVHVGLKCCYLRIPIALVILQNQSRYLFNKFFSPNETNLRFKKKIVNSYFLFHSSSGCTMKGQHSLNSQKYSEIFHYRPRRHLWILHLGVENFSSHLWTLFCYLSHNNLSLISFPHCKAPIILRCLTTSLFPG